MAGRNLADERLTAAVRESFANASSERLRTVLDALVRHLHGFAADVGLTEDEWLAGIQFLTEAGHVSDDTRQELVLLSDVLGLSMLVIGLNHGGSETATEQTVFGPFFVEGAPRFRNGDDLANGAPGEACLVSGRVRSIDGQPIAGARVDVWQADEDGMYDVQYDGTVVARGRGHLYSDAAGEFWFRTIRPTAYPIPTDGPVGRLLEAAGRTAMRPAHIHFRVQADGYRTLTTHVFAAGDPYLDSDAVFGVKESLIAPFEQGSDGTWSLRYDFVLEHAGRRPPAHSS
ncbi:MAG TPA: intradiol ring-cleavage dioxygenase [Gaiellaceae bacterium]|nr:intradiol ring-cleavage dioxygenase [Gaiellaceae bacterium]